MTTTANQIQIAASGSAEPFLQGLSADARTFFRRQHVKYTPHSMSHTMSNPVSTATCDQNDIQLPVPKSADFLLASFVRLAMPAVTASIGTAAAAYRYHEDSLPTATAGYAPYGADDAVATGMMPAVGGYWVAWQQEVGHIVIKELRFVVSGAQFFRLSGEAMAAIEDIFGQQGVKQMDAIGKYSSLDVRVAKTSVAHNLYVEIPAWYSAANYKSIVLSAAPLNNLSYSMDTRPIAQCLEVSNDGIIPQVSSATIAESAITFKIVNCYATVTSTERGRYTARNQSDIMTEWQSLTVSHPINQATLNLRLSFTGPVAAIVIFGRLDANKNGFDFLNFTTSQPEDSSIKGFSSTANAIDAPAAPMNDPSFSGSSLLASALGTQSATLDTLADSQIDKTGTGWEWKPATKLNVRPDLFATIQVNVNGNAKVSANQDAEFFRTVTYRQQKLNPPTQPLYMYPFCQNLTAAGAVGALNFSRVDEVGVVAGLATETVGGTDYFGPMEVFVLAKSHNIVTYQSGSMSKSLA